MVSRKCSSDEKGEPSCVCHLSCDRLGDQNEKWPKHLPIAYELDYASFTFNTIIKDAPCIREGKKNH